MIIWIPPHPPDPPPFDRERWRRLSPEEREVELKHMADDALWEFKAVNAVLAVFGIAGAIFLIASGAWIWLLVAIGIAAVLARLFLW